VLFYHYSLHKQLEMKTGSRQFWHMSHRTNNNINLLSLQIFYRNTSAVINLHLRRQRDSTRQLSRVGVVGVNSYCPRNSTQLNCRDCGQQYNDVINIVTSRCCAQTTRCLLEQLSWVELSCVVGVNGVLYWLQLDSSEASRQCMAPSQASAAGMQAPLLVHWNSSDVQVALTASDRRPES